MTYAKLAALTLLLAALAGPAVAADRPARPIPATDETQQQAVLPSRGAVAAAAPSPAPSQGLAALTLSAPDTPDGRPYLAIARAEAEVAGRHLDAALAESRDLAAMKREVALALHAVDPQLGNAGGGDLGFGLRPAVDKASRALPAVPPDTVLAAAEPAGDSLQEVATALASVHKRLDEGCDVGRAALVTQSPMVARQAARAMQISLDRAVKGWDRNADGRIDWRAGEAGLTQATAIATRLARQER